MGRGKVWSADESAHLAEAWVNASEDAGEPEVKGTNQDSDAFWAKVKAKFAERAPPNPDGVYHDRTTSAITNHWKEKISRDVKRFNKALLQVFASKPSGVTEQEKINIAVAIHVKKADNASSRHRDFQPMDWVFYKSWLVLKEHRAFIPPTAQQLEDAEELDDEDDDLIAPTDTSPPSGEVLFTTPVPNPSAGKSHGPGAGCRKTKAKAMDEEFKNKEYKLQEELLEVQKKKQADFSASSYVNNQARAQAFKIAVMGYNAMKDTEPAEAQRYKDKMNEILGGVVTTDDTDEEGEDGSGLND